MKKLYTISIILLSSLSFGQSPISLIGVNVPYNENFDGMGILTTFPPGWTAINKINGTTLTMGVSDGTANLGNAYNVGTIADERALGTLADATTTPEIGAVFQNNTGNTVSKVTIQTKMEQWRESGNASINETVAFYYSLDATSLNTGNWTAVTALNLNEKLTDQNSNMAVNGNLIANYNGNIGSIISGLNWANGANLWIKWVDTNDTGANGMYAIDNFTISIGEVLGVKQNTIAGLNMYPNPVSKGTLYITSNSSETKSVSIFDLLGKQVLNTKTSNSAINISSLTAGSYIVKITEDGKTDTKKLIIE